MIIIQQLYIVNGFKFQLYQNNGFKLHTVVGLQSTDS